jgi:hypothetical protein
MAREQKKSGAKAGRARKLNVKKQSIRDLGPSAGVSRRVKGGALNSSPKLGRTR